MADLIDRAKVLNAFKQICESCGKYKQNNGAMCRACYLDDAISIVDDIPAVVDTDLSGSSFRLYRAAYDRGKQEAMAGIVRCKDCKFYTPMNRETKTGICNLTLHQNFGDDWFCAGAERRYDETD